MVRTMYDPDNPQSIEKYSSAVTLSDMEIFLFPELLYSLVLANIMSPLLWKWREDSWFANMYKMNDYRRLLRTKQFIMDRFAFNLDLDTWGLTTKERELSRFSSLVDEPVLARSNALFGYEGDKYYFDLDIRKHFGLDKYTSNVIPYWKTETVEAMEAFKYKEGYPTGAGECVSLSTLYASALFVIGRIPLDKIHLMATPLHSQNFIDIRNGVLTNNRRIVTKNMWFNGSELSTKAKRALEHEKVTMVTNNSGYIHTLYDQATMVPEVYNDFSTKLSQYLQTDINYEILACFLRQHSSLQKCFQIVHNCCGKPRYIEIENVFHYEHSSKSRIGDKTQTNLLHEIDEDDYYPSPIEGRIILNELESFFALNKFQVDSEEVVDKLKSYLHHGCFNVDEVMKDLKEFCKMKPQLPSSQKKWETQKLILLDNVSSHSEIISILDTQYRDHPIVNLAFMAYRDMSRSPWKPFLKAALERNPVIIEALKEATVDQAAEKIAGMKNESIYDGTRMAQPDEVWNYGRGDGLEKAISLMNILKHRIPEEKIRIEGDGTTVCVSVKGGNEYVFQTGKGLELPKKEDFSF